MIYNPRSKANVSIRRRAAESASLEHYKQTCTSKSATEGLDETIVQEKVSNDLVEFVISHIFELLNEGKVFFSDDPEVAYQELLDLLDKPEVKGKIILWLERYNDLDTVGEDSTELNALAKQYDSASRRADGLARESRAAESFCNELKAKITAIRPDYFDEEE